MQWISATGDAIATGEERASKVSESDTPNTSSEKRFRDEFGGLALHWWIVIVWGLLAKLTACHVVMLQLGKTICSGLGVKISARSTNR